MIVNNFSENYYIKRLEQNPVNQYKYIYIDSSDGNLSFINNKWKIDIWFYVIQNFSLPLNIFTVNLNTQFASIEDISINIDLSKHTPDWIVQKNFCVPYFSSFWIDTNDSKFFEQKIDKFELIFDFNLDVDMNILNNLHLDLSQKDFDEFVNETYQQTSILKFNYSNYFESNQVEGKIIDITSYYLNSKKGSYSNEEVIYYSTNNNTTEIDNPIKKLLTINFKEYSLIWQKIKFVYQIDGYKQQELCYENSEPKFGYGDLNIFYNQNTYFDDKEKTIVNQINGINGFYCPLKCSGYYEISIKIQFNESIKTLKFVNNFSFMGNDQYKNKKIIINKIFLNDVTYFREEIF